MTNSYMHALPNKPLSLRTTGRKFSIDSACAQEKHQLRPAIFGRRQSLQPMSLISNYEELTPDLDVINSILSLYF